MNETNEKNADMTNEELTEEELVSPEAAQDTGADPAEKAAEAGPGGEGIQEGSAGDGAEDAGKGSSEAAAQEAPKAEPGEDLDENRRFAFVDRAAETAYPTEGVSESRTCAKKRVLTATHRCGSLKARSTVSGNSAPSGAPAHPPPRAPPVKRPVSMRLRSQWRTLP